MRAAQVLDRSLSAPLLLLTEAVARLRDRVPTHHDLHTGGRTIRLRDGRRLCPHGWADPPGS